VSTPTRREQNAAATRAALVGAARRLFAEHGYADVSTGQIVAAASVTRGALYHHFADKREVMAAVFAEVDGELVERVRAASASVEGPLERLDAGIAGFLDAIADPELQRIAFVEAPAALGWAQWRRLDAGRSLQLVVEQLQAAIDAGLIAPRDPVALAHLLLGAMNEAGMFVASSRDPARARRAVGEDLTALLGGLRR